MRVFVVASMMAMRLGLRALLSAFPAIEVTGEAASLLDVARSLAEMDVLVVAGETTFPARLDDSLLQHEIPPAILVLTDDASAAQELFELRWRAWGVLPADAAPEELFAAVQALHEGLLVGPPALLKAALKQGPLRREQENLPYEALTAREAEVLQLLAQGLANKQISRTLGISEHTVKFHVSSLYAKLGATSRTEAVRKGFQRGLVIL